MTMLKRNWLWLLVNLIAVLPLIGIAGSLGEEFLNRTLDPAPIVQEAPMPEPTARPEHQERSPLAMAEHVSGEWAIRFLVISLTMTPLYILFGWRQGLGLKRSTGLWAFGYTVIHFIAFGLSDGWLATFDQFNYIVGLLALLIMVPLAITSHSWWMKRLHQHWKLLHRAAYVAGLFAVLHLVFLGEGSAVLYGLILGIGLLVRVPQLRKQVTQYRRHLFRHQPISA